MQILVDLTSQLTSRGGVSSDEAEEARLVPVIERAEAKEALSKLDTAITTEGEFYIFYV